MKSLEAIIENFDTWCGCGKKECAKSENYLQAKQAIKQLIQKEVVKGRVGTLQECKHNIDEQVEIYLFGQEDGKIRYIVDAFAQDLNSKIDGYISRLKEKENTNKPKEEI